MQRERFKLLMCWLVPLLCLLGFCSILLLPKPGQLAPSAVNMQLPMLIEDWQGQPKSASPEERSTLASDTEFAKAQYSKDGEQHPLQRMNLSVVLSGSDLNNSIHRPERCLPAQGHYGLQASQLEITLKNGKKIPLTRLHGKQLLKSNTDKSFEIDGLHYYVFVGHKSITASHLQRTLLDMKDRILHGYDQRWAYIQLSCYFGDYPELGYKLQRQQAEERALQLLARIAEENIDWQQIRP